MIKGFLVNRHILSCMRIYVEGFHIISVDKTISFMGHIVSAVVLKTLSVEVFAESCV